MKQTFNVYQRPLEVSDVILFYQLMSHPLTTQYLPDDNRITSIDNSKQVLGEMINNTRSKERLCIAIARSSDNQIIGTLIANKGDMMGSGAYISYVLHPDYWGRNIMSKQIERFISFIQTQWFLNAIYALTTFNNTCSQVLLERLGFKNIKEFIFDKPIDRQLVLTYLYFMSVSS